MFVLKVFENLQTRCLYEKICLFIYLFLYFNNTLKNNIEFPTKISEIANRLQLSVRTLEREFIYAHSMSPLKFYLRLRLNHAKNFLYYENYKINVISNMCGFNYNSVFNHAFKKEFQITPKEYRNNSRKFQNEHIKPELKKLN